MTIFPCPCRVLPIKRTKENNDSQASTHYQDCCKPLHKGEAFAQSAEQLMRSRYSAFVLGLIDYIVDTTLPLQQSLLDKQTIAEWSTATEWAGLQIVEHQPKVGKRHAKVQFKAFYRQPTQLGVTDAIDAHHEYSTFVKVKAIEEDLSNSATNSLSNLSENSPATLHRWYFLDPTVDMNRLNVSQKQPCVCGSGEKFKRCCGPYL